MSYNPQLPGVTVEQWASDVLRGIGAPVNETNVDTLRQWATRESGSGNPNVCPGRFNPLNTTESHYGFACQGGSQGNISGYSTYQQGVDSIVWNLTHGADFGYPAILQGFHDSNQQETFAAIDASSFGTKGLGNGSTEPSGGPSSGSSAGGAATLDSASSSEPCILKLPGITLPSILPNIGGGCILDAAKGRALLGAVTLLAGGSLMLIGVLWLARKPITGALAPIASVAKVAA